MDRNVFVYWVGKEYALIKILRKTIYRHSTNGRGYTVHFITDKNITEYTKDVPAWFHKAEPAVQADFIRVNVVCERGGIWLDADTLVMDSLDPLFEVIDRKDGFLVKENNIKLCNGVFGSKPNTPLLLEWKRLIHSITEKKQEKVGWNEIGNGILETLRKYNLGIFSNYEIMNGLDTIYPVNWDKCVAEFIEKPYDNYKTIVRSFQPLVVLVNFVYRKLESMTEEEILKGTMPLNYFLNESQARVPSQGSPVRSSTTDVSTVLAVAKKTKRVGIVIHDKASMFSNGIVQNAYFLYQCLEAKGYTCQFLCGEPNPSPFEHDRLTLKQITTDPSIFNPSDYHTIITVTRRISPEMYKLCNRNQIGVISLVCGNCYILDQEDFVRGRVGDSNTFLGSSRNIDEQWLIPSYHHSLEYLELVRKKPATLVPHLWSSSILKHFTPCVIQKPESDLFFDISKRKNKKVNIVIMEPNMSTMKTAWMPILACERLHMTHPDLIEHVFVFNFPSHKNSWEMTETFTVSPKIRKFTRKSVAEIMWYFNTQTECFPLFLSHQMLNSLNYIYYELLYYGFPLVHNSPDLDNCGYMFPENNISKCAEQMFNAYNNHISTLDTYNEKSKKYLNRVDPFDVEVQNAFDTRLIASMTASLTKHVTLDRICKVMYINLDKQTEPRKRMENELERLGVSAERFPAIISIPDAVGYGMSHVAILKRAIAEKWENVLLLDDTVRCAVDRATFDKRVDQLLSSNIEYDVVMLSHTLTEGKPHNELVMRVTNAQNSAAYLVHKRFYAKLLENYETGITQLMKGAEQSEYGLDQYWKSLQTTSMWFCFKDPLFVSV